MSTVLSSIDAMLQSAANNGTLCRCFWDQTTGATTAATTTCGYISAQRMQNGFTIPSVAANVKNIYFPTIKVGPVVSNPSVGCVTGLEYLLGTVTANGGTGSFVDGVAMPTKLVNGANVQTATMQIFAVITTVMVGAGTYTLTITYTNQAGTTSQTSTLTIPNVAIVGSAFNITPHLANGDSGVRDITGITLTGTTGVIIIYGLLTLHASAPMGQGTASMSPSPMVVPQVKFPASAGELINTYVLGDNTGGHTMLTILVGVADV